METAKLGLWLALGTVTMLFAAFTSAYIVRSAGETGRRSRCRTSGGTRRFCSFRA
jgi:heme/copper-type cytochrome/quinol oxidase subunit 3